MNLITRTLNKIFKSGNQQELNKIKPLIIAINEKESSFSALKDAEFKEKSDIPTLTMSVSHGSGNLSIYLTLHIMTCLFSY